MFLSRKLKAVLSSRSMNTFLILILAANVTTIVILVKTLRSNPSCKEGQLQISRDNDNFETRGTVPNGIKTKVSKSSFRLHKGHQIPTLDHNYGDDYYEALIKKDDAFKIEGLGEGGVAVNLQGDDSLNKEMERNGGFNVLLSDRISYFRKVPDFRHPNCRNVMYSEDLPSASVVIVFHNEEWSVLIRTVHNVLNRSPSRLLKEIVMVDDLSDNSNLKGKLDYYVKTRFPHIVRLVRLSVRSGLIRAKIEGARKASGDVLVFLDAHCEVGYTWLEPMLDRIKQKRSVVTVPLIDPINGSTLEFKDVISDPQYFPIGGFEWNGYFVFFALSNEKLEKRLSPIEPVRSPTMVGGLFAIDRQYFWESGSYDSEMDIWGGENLEMSFRIWQCGGSIETIPCSRVGHVYRPIRPYSFPRIKDTHGYNTARMAEVWMDDYKEILYIYRPDLKGRNIGDLSERKNLRKELKCKSFDWYLDNVFPKVFVPTKNVTAYGQVENKEWCLDTLGQTETQYELGIYPCNPEITVSQFFSFTKTNELRTQSHCAEIQIVQSKPIHVTMFPCHGLQGNQLWNLTGDGAFINIKTGLCLDSSSDGGKVTVSQCTGSLIQKWNWSKYF